MTTPTEEPPVLFMEKDIPIEADKDDEIVETVLENGNDEKAVEMPKLVKKPEPQPVKRRIFLRLVRKRKKPDVSEKSENSDKSEPLKKKSELYKKESELLKKESELLKKESELLEKEAELLKKASEPPKKESEPLKQESLAERLRKLTLCKLCGIQKPGKLMAPFTIKMERMFVVLSYVFCRKMSMNEAIVIFYGPWTEICKSHFVTAVTDLMKVLGIYRPLDIWGLGINRMNVFKVTIARICGLSLKMNKIKQLMLLFIKKFQCPRAVVPVNRVRDPENAPDNFKKRFKASDFENSEILPKFARQPRKQKLEDENKTDSIVRIIEKEQFHLPVGYIRIPEIPMKNPKCCCFCLKILEKNVMVKIPMSENRLHVWLQKLGEEFQSRLRKNFDNFMCRNHFSKESFSKRGRLLKGCLPETVGEPRIAAEFRIDGDEFVKVVELDRVKKEEPEY